MVSQATTTTTTPVFTDPAIIQVNQLFLNVSPSQTQLPLNFLCSKLLVITHHLVNRVTTLRVLSLRVTGWFRIPAHKIHRAEDFLGQHFKAIFICTNPLKAIQPRGPNHLLFQPLTAVLLRQCITKAIMGFRTGRRPSSNLWSRPHSASQCQHSLRRRFSNLCSLRPHNHRTAGRCQHLRRNKHSFRNPIHLLFSFRSPISNHLLILLLRPLL